MSHGHDANTDSWLKRTLFYVSLFVTVYGLIELVQVWPTQTAPTNVLSAKEGITKDGHVSDVKHDALKSFLQELDQWYETEINVDHHEDDDHGSHDDHEDEDVSDEAKVVIVENVVKSEEVREVSSLMEGLASDKVASIERGDQVAEDSVNESIIDPFHNDAWTESSKELQIEGLGKEDAKKESDAKKVADANLDAQNVVEAENKDYNNNNNNNNIYEDIYNDITDDDLNELLRHYVE